MKKSNWAILLLPLLPFLPLTFVKSLSVIASIL